jgi:glycosyltransferase involved in cell wall biosynthesis
MKKPPLAANGAAPTQPSVQSILHVVPGLGRDGALSGSSRLALLLTQFMQKNTTYGADICVLSGTDPFWSAYGLARSPYFLQLPRLEASPFRLLISCLRLRRLVRACDPPLVHSHTWPAALVSGFALWGLRVRHLVHIHDMRPWLASPLWRHRLRRSIHRWAFRLSRASFVACVNAAADFTRRHLLPPDADVTTVRSGIDLSQVRPPSSTRDASGPVILGMAGAFQVLKGHRVLLEALAKVRSRGLDVRLRLAGYGAEEKVIRQLAQDLNLADSVCFMGLVRDMPGFMAALDIYVLPSMSEGLPLSILEAMAHGLPVIATQVGGIAEAVRSGVEGLLVPAADVPALAEAIERLARDPDLRQSLGASGRRRAREEFTVEVMGEQILKTYNRLLTSSR